MVILKAYAKFLKFQNKKRFTFMDPFLFSGKQKFSFYREYIYIYFLSQYNLVLKIFFEHSSFCSKAWTELLQFPTLHSHNTKNWLSPFQYIGLFKRHLTPSSLYLSWTSEATNLVQVIGNIRELSLEIQKMIVIRDKDNSIKNTWPYINNYRTFFNWDYKKIKGINKMFRNFVHILRQLLIHKYINIKCSLNQDWHMDKSSSTANIHLCRSCKCWNTCVFYKSTQAKIGSKLS